MALHGSLLTMPLADLLSWVKSARRAGTLTVYRDGNEWELQVGEGAVLSYSGPELRDNLGYIIVTSGLLSEDDLRIAYQHQRQSRVSLQRALLDNGFIDPASLAACLRELATESIYDLFLDLPGEFTFSDIATGLSLELDPSDERLPLHLGINQLLMEGAQRHDEALHIRERYPTDDLQIELIEAKLQDFDSLGVRERRILASLSAGQSLTDMCFELRAPVPSVLCILARFEAAGSLKIRPLTADEKRQSKSADRVTTLVEQAMALRQAGQFDEAIALLAVVVRMRPDLEVPRTSHRDALEEQLNELYSIVPPLKVPKVVASDERINRLRLRPDERFVLERLSAGMDVGSLIMVSSLSERETLKLLRKLLHSQVIELH